MNSPFTHDFEFGFSRAIFEIGIFQERENRLTRKEMDMSQIRCWDHYAALNFDPNHDLALNFWNS